MTGEVNGSLLGRGSSLPGPIQIDSREIKLSMLEKNNVIFGPPGTGKTTAIEWLIKQIRAESVDPDNPSLVYLTYSRALAKEARERIGLHNKAMIGTFHSVLSRMLGWVKAEDGGNFLTDKDVEEFCRKYGIQKSGKVQMEREDNEGDDEWSRFLMLYEKSYASYPKITKPSLFMNDLPFNVDVITEKYNKFKASTGRHDYVDILVEAYERLELPHVKYLIVDEAQDMNPLMWSIVDKWPKDKLIITGDDDQSIYEFRGADPRLFLERRKDAKIFHLSETHRFGPNILGLCRDVSRRIQSREQKEYSAAPIADKVERRFNLDEFLDLNGSKMILFRTRFLASSYSRELIERMVPFLPLNSRHAWISPWSRALIRLNNAISSFPNISDDDLAFLVSYLPAHLLRRGIKTQIEKDGIGSVRNAIRGTLVTSIMDVIFENVPNREDLLRNLKIPDGKKRLISKMKKIEDNDLVYVDTFHASKGKESNNVAVALDMTKKVFNSFMENPDSEWRMLYVAVSRARNHLSLFSLNITEWRYQI
ncbi:MAG: ATP-dependent helicase [Candidatus Parvarchaeota archaeon]